MTEKEMDSWYEYYMNMDMLTWTFNYLLIALICMFVVLLGIRGGIFLQKKYWPLWFNERGTVRAQAPKQQNLFV